MCSTGVPSALIICAVWFTASGGEDKIVVAGNEENWRLDLLEPLGEIAAARDKELTGLDKVEEVVGAALCYCNDEPGAGLGSDRAQILMRRCSGGENDLAWPFRRHLPPGDDHDG